MTVEVDMIRPARIALLCSAGCVVGKLNLQDLPDLLDLTTIF